VNDRRALEVIDELTVRGIKIPEDVSVMGFDDFESSKFSKISLSTVKQYFDVLGYQAAELLLSVSRADSYGFKKIYLPTSLVIRDTVAPPPQ
jgi:GntR family transcriptional regulator of arabinose operon